MDCTGFGSTGRSGIDTVAPSWATRSSVQSRGSRCTYSSHEIFVVSGSTPKPPSSVQVEARAVPNSKPSTGEDVEDRCPLRDPDRMVHLRHTHDCPMADADPLGLHRHRGEEQLGRAAT